MAGQLTLVGSHALGNGGLLLRLLAQDGFTDDAFDIGVGELRLDREARLKSLQGGCSTVQRGLAGANQKQAAAKIGADMLGDFLNVICSLNLIADELLYLVNDQQRAGELPALSKNLLHHVERIANRGGIVVLELIPDGRLSVGGAGIFGLGTDQRFSQRDRQLQAANFLSKFTLLLLERRLDLGFQPGRAKPEDKSGLRKVLRQVGGAQHQLDEREADVVHRARAKRPCGRAHTTQRLAAIA